MDSRFRGNDIFRPFATILFYILWISWTCFLLSSTAHTRTEKRIIITISLVRKAYYNRSYGAQLFTQISIRARTDGIPDFRISLLPLSSRNICRRRKKAHNNPRTDIPKTDHIETCSNKVNPCNIFVSLNFYALIFCKKTAVDIKVKCSTNNLFCQTQLGLTFYSTRIGIITKGIPWWCSLLWMEKVTWL